MSMQIVEPWDGQQEVLTMPRPGRKYPWTIVIQADDGGFYWGLGSQFSPDWVATGWEADIAQARASAEAAARSRSV